MRDPRMTGYTPHLIPGVTVEEVVMVGARAVSCDGGSAGSGHPLIWMRIDGHEVTCPYCSRTFRLAEGPMGEMDDDGHH